MNKNNLRALKFAILGGALGTAVAGLGVLSDAYRRGDKEESTRDNNFINVSLRNRLRGMAAYDASHPGQQVKKKKQTAGEDDGSGDGKKAEYIPDPLSVGVGMASGVGTFLVAHKIINKIVRNREHKKLEESKKMYADAVNAGIKQASVGKLLGYSLLAGGTTAALSSIIVNRIIKNRAESNKDDMAYNNSRYPIDKRITFSI